MLNGLLHRDPPLSNVPRAGIVHRLDKDTSGLMVVAQDCGAQTDLVRQIAGAHGEARLSRARVGHAVPEHGAIDAPIGRDPRDRTRMAGVDSSPSAQAGAIPHYRTLATGDSTGGRVSCVECRLETGRTHQIRVHLQALGHPLVGDAVYGGPALIRCRSRARRCTRGAWA